MERYTSGCLQGQLSLLSESFAVKQKWREHSMIFHPWAGLLQLSSMSSGGLGLSAQGLGSPIWSDLGFRKTFQVCRRLLQQRNQLTSSQTVKPLNRLAIYRGNAMPASMVTHNDSRDLLVRWIANRISRTLDT